MNIRGLFRTAQTWSAQEVKDFLQSAHPEDYLLLDVSRPEEYRKGHLPGARSFPLEELEERLRGLDSGKPTIVYGGSALRSLAAVSLLVHAGFSEVHRMEGGLQAWHGNVAAGAPAADLEFFSRAHTSEEHAALAWQLEEGTRRFYAEMASRVKDKETAVLFRELVSAEEHHKSTLTAPYEGLTGKPVSADFPAGVLKEGEGEDLMEGGMRLSEALKSVQGMQIRHILEMAVRLETNAYDRYLLMRLELPDENARRVFEILSDEERRHLRKLDQLLRHFI
jgi:sulfur-carrier protein adenylyltransferase/sulfurtransferase